MSSNLYELCLFKLNENICLFKLNENNICVCIRRESWFISRTVCPCNKWSPLFCAQHARVNQAEVLNNISLCNFGYICFNKLGNFQPPNKLGITLSSISYFKIICKCCHFLIPQGKYIYYKLELQNATYRNSNYLVINCSQPYCSGPNNSNA